MKKRSPLHDNLIREESDALKTMKANAREKDKTLTRFLLPSILSMFLCMVCLFSMTWAWFSDSTAPSPSKIVAGSYRIDTEISKEGAAVPMNESGSTLLEAGTYTVKLTAYGTGQKGFGGYAIVELALPAATVADGENAATPAKSAAYTVLLENGNPGESMTVTLELQSAAELRIVSQWGVPPTKNGELSLPDTATLTMAANGTLSVSIPTEETVTTAETTTAVQESESEGQ